MLGWTCWTETSAPLFCIRSPNCDFLLCWELFQHENYADTFWQICISHRRHTELKCSAPWRTTLQWHQMAYGAGNCRPLLTYRKQIPTYELQCSPWNTASSRVPQVHYFPSFQTLSAIRNADSSTKQVHPWRPAALW
jgi:hypothetical protein